MIKQELLTQQGPKKISIDSRYRDIVRDPNQRPTALSLAREAYIPRWNLAKINPNEQLSKQAYEQSRIEAQYERARKLCDDGDVDMCDEADAHEMFLGLILQTADEIYPTDEKIVGRVTQSGNKQVLAYSADD